MITIYKTDTFKDAAKYVTDVVKRVDKTNLSVMHTVLVPGWRGQFQCASAYFSQALRRHFAAHGVP